MAVVHLNTAIMMIYRTVKAPFVFWLLRKTTQDSLTLQRVYPYQGLWHSIEGEEESHPSAMMGGLVMEDESPVVATHSVADATERNLLLHQLQVDHRK